MTELPVVRMPPLRIVSVAAVPPVTLTAAVTPRPRNSAVPAEAVLVVVMLTRSVVARPVKVLVLS